MATSFGRTMPIGLVQQQRLDWITFSEAAPVRAVERSLQIGQTRNSRSAAIPQPSWLAIFTKAYALTAYHWPQLRQTYLSYPWTRIFEHPHAVASVAIVRGDFDQETSFQLPIRRPENQSLKDLDYLLRRASNQPIEGIRPFRQTLLSCYWPRLLRWSVYHLTLCGLGFRRSNVLGTFAVNACSGGETMRMMPRSPLTSTLTFGVVNGQGEVDVRIGYDPRVLTSSLMTKVFVELERILNEEIVGELRYLEGLGEAA